MALQPLRIRDVRNTTGVSKDLDWLEHEEKSKTIPRTFGAENEPTRMVDASAVQASNGVDRGLLPGELHPNSPPLVRDHGCVW